MIYLFFCPLIRIFAPESKKNTNMTTIELNAELYRAMGDKMLDAALTKFHKDWGGEGSAMEIAEELRSGRDNSRTIETW